MTTVVATRTSIASDSMMTVNDASYESRKLYEIGDSLVGIAGTSSDSRKFLKWFENQDSGTIPDFTEDGFFRAIELSPRGLFLWEPSLVPLEVLSPHLAIGTGSQAALAALHWGATLEQAVETACAIDINSGGPVRVLHLTPPPQ